jgi:23S rRNA pseudouridine955/2504/2580 synthase
VVKRIIGAAQVPPDTTQTRGTAPAVRRVTVDEGSAGQRLDNFLLRELKGVPKTHVYRVIRAGEVRVNKGRAHADTRLEMGDEVRIPPVRLPERPVQPEAPAREFPVVFEDEHLLVIDKPAGVRCTADRASAMASSRRCGVRGRPRSSSSWCTGWTRKLQAF